LSKSEIFELLSHRQIKKESDNNPKLTSTSKLYLPSKRSIQIDSSIYEASRGYDLEMKNGDSVEIGCINNQAIDESKLKLILNELKVAQKQYPKVEFINNTFKCNYIKVIKHIVTDRLLCNVQIDEKRNKIQVKAQISKKEMSQLKELNVTILNN